MLSLLLLLSCTTPDPAGAPAPEPATAPTPSERADHLLIIAIDGMDWKVLGPLLNAGEAPNLRALIDAGVHGPLLTLRPTLSPVIWTTIATGLPMEAHGIDSFWHEVSADAAGLSAAEAREIETLQALGYIDAAGERQMRLYASTDRKVDAFWNVLSDRGHETDLVGWWVTWPAEPILGNVVSDRYVFNRFALEAAARDMPFERDGQLTHPASLAERLAPLQVSADSVALSEFGALEPSAEGVAAAGAGGGEGEMIMHRPEDELRMVVAKDRSMVAFAEALLADDPALVTAVYLQSADISSHYFWKERFPEDWAKTYPDDPLSPERVAAAGGVIDQVYREIDASVGRLVAAAPEGSAVVVCSDHGFLTGKRPHGRFGSNETVSGDHSVGEPPGVLIVAGPGVPAQRRVEGFSVTDLTPTFYDLVDQAPPELPGRSLLSGD